MSVTAGRAELRLGRQNRTDRAPSTRLSAGRRACGDGPGGCTLPECAHRQALHVPSPQPVARSAGDRRVRRAAGRDVRVRGAGAGVPLRRERGIVVDGLLLGTTPLEEAPLDEPVEEHLRRGPAAPEQAGGVAGPEAPGTCDDAGGERVVEGDRAACGGVGVEVRGRRYAGPEGGAVVSAARAPRSRSCNAASLRRSEIASTLSCLPAAGAPGCCPPQRAGRRRTGRTSPLRTRRRPPSRRTSTNGGPGPRASGGVPPRCCLGSARGGRGRRAGLATASARR